MACLYFFNCDNDLALANFSPGFTPPGHIRMMMDELAPLPLDWAEEDRAACVASMLHGPSADADILSSLGEVRPWGWSPAACHRLRQMGVPEHLLPSSSELLEIRRLSSRERAVELLCQMREDGVCSDFQSVFCLDEAQVEEALCRWPRTILKAPWSGSGKGLRYGQGGREDTLMGWCRRVISQQGGVVVEPLYDKLYDLAMEFWSDGKGCVTYQGLSLFETHPNGAYSGNLLMPEAEKQAWLDQFVPVEQSLAVRLWLERRLSSLVGKAYRGYLGVDMMLTAPPTPEGEKFCPKVGGRRPTLVGEVQKADDERLASVGEVQKTVLHPMVEVNLRMTMGMVSILLQRRQPKGFHGVFRLDYFPDPADLEADNARRASHSSTFRILASGAHYRAYLE